MFGNPELNAEIKLNFIGHENISERKKMHMITSDVGGRIKELGFSDLRNMRSSEGGIGDVLKMSSSLKKDVEEFDEQMKKWKERAAEKKEEVRTMEKRKTGRNHEYRGEEDEGKENGFGILVGVDGPYVGDHFEGEFKHGKYDGKGVYYWTNGDRYEGEFKEDKRNGKGFYYWANGNRYEGEWKDNKQHGKGIFHWVEGDRYEGEWKENSKDGMGVFYWINGNWKEGEYKKGQSHGKVILHHKTGETEEQIYENGLRIDRM